MGVCSVCNSARVGGIDDEMTARSNASEHLKHLQIAVLAGGSGTRFWPASRRAWPKQFLALGPDAEVSLIEATVKRVLGLVPLEHMMVITGVALEAATRELLKANLPAKILAEPVARNTAPAVAWAAREAMLSDPDAIVCVLPADAYIKDTDAFCAALTKATEAAAGGNIVTLGIEPTRPETGYGYLHVGEATEIEGVFRVRAFVEKPDLAQAQKYLAGGEHLWNGGIFVFRASVMDQAVREHLPALWEGMNTVEHAKKTLDTAGQLEAIRTVFMGLKSVSIDYGVMEKVSAVDVVRADCGWSDVGSWEASWELGAKDDEQNVRHGDPSQMVLIDSKRTFVSVPKNKVVAVIGVQDLIIVDTPDALLVMPRARAQEVKAAVDALIAAKKTEYI